MQLMSSGGIVSEELSPRFFYIGKGLPVSPRKRTQACKRLRYVHLSSRICKVHVVLYECHAETELFLIRSCQLPALQFYYGVRGFRTIFFGSMENVM